MRYAAAVGFCVTRTPSLFIYPDRFAAESDMIDQPLQDRLMLTDIEDLKAFLYTDDGPFGWTGQTLVQEGHRRFNILIAENLVRVLGTNSDPFYVFNIS
nr:hypothetical protein [uncultured Desulfobacter sp.]